MSKAPTRHACYFCGITASRSQDSSHHIYSALLPIAMISKIRRSLSLLLPRKHASRQHKAPAKTVTRPVAKDLQEQESPSAVSVENVERQDVPALEPTSRSPSSDSNLLKTPELGGPQLPTPPTSTKKEGTDNTNYLLPSVEDARDEDLGSPITFLCQRSSRSASTDKFQPLTPPTSKPKKRKRRDSDPTYYPLDDDFSDDSENLDGQTLVENELASISECKRSTRKRKRVSNRDPTFRLSSVLQDSTDSDLEGDTLIDSVKKKRKRKTKNKTNGVSTVSQNKHSEDCSDVPNTYTSSRSVGHQPRGTLWDTDSKWSGDESGDGLVRHHTRASLSGDLISKVSSRGSTPSKRSRSSLRDAPYLPPRETVNRRLTKSIVAPDAIEGDMSDEEEWTEKNAVRKHDKNEVASDFSMEKAKRWAGAVTLPDGKWAEAEQDLYFRLAMRGFEPLVPNNWHLDFPTLPDTLFALRDGPEPLIQALSDKEFRGKSSLQILQATYLLTRRNPAIKFLGDLFSLGSRVRDRKSTPLGPESIIERTVKRYLGWALRDANIHNRPNAIPVYDIYTLRKGQSTREAVTRLNCRLVSLAKRYRDSLRLAQSIENPDNEGNHGRETQVQYSRERKFPVLTGFLICGPIVAVTTLDSDPNACPDLDSGVSCKLIAQFDMGEHGQDVWNALAIAITVMRVRKTMIELEEEGQGDWMWMIDDKYPHDDTDEDT